MILLVAFSESIDEAAAYANIAAVPDDYLDTSGDLIRIPEGVNKIFGKVAYVGTTGTRVRLSCPSLRQFQNLYVTPVNQVLVPTGHDVIDIHPESLIPLEATENLECEVYADPAAAEQHTIGVWLTDKDISPVRGDIRPVPFSVTMAIVAGVWNTGSITLEEELPKGAYELVGGRIECVVGTLGRFILPKSMDRPGFVLSADEDFRQNDIFRYGRLGVWGSFDNISLPKAEILGAAATGSATYQGIMDVIRR